MRRRRAPDPGMPRFDLIGFSKSTMAEEAPPVVAAPAAPRPKPMMKTPPLPEGQGIEAHIWFDGASRGNPGAAAGGAIIRCAQSNALLGEVGILIGTATNNVAEYDGLIAGLALAKDLGLRRISIRGDSKLVVEQVKGAWKVKHPAMIVKRAAVRALLDGFESFRISHVPRHLNSEADEIGNRALDRRTSIRNIFE